MKIVFLTTVQFSGTRLLHLSVARAVNSIYPRTQIAFVKGRRRIAANIHGGSKTFTFSNDINELIKNIIKVSNSKKSIVNIVTAHCGGYSGFIPFIEQEKIMDVFPSAATLRDPLASLLTRQARGIRVGDTDSHQYLTDGQVSLAQSTKNIYFLPVDVYSKRPYEDRLKLITGLFKSLGLNNVSKDYISLVASEWQVKGDIKNDPSVPDKVKEKSLLFKDWYNSGDINSIKKEIPNCYNYLKSKEKILRPFLEKHGYENLIWWD